MKTTQKIKSMLLSLVLLGFCNIVNAQRPETSISYVNLDEIILSPIKNVTYYNAVHDSYAAKGVINLETAAASYDISSSDLYGKYESYLFIFKNHLGKIMAIYDNEGELVKSVEKFENIQLSEKVRLSLLSEYPGWRLNSTVFKVKYANNKDVERVYHLQIVKDDKKLNLKVNCDGDVLSSRN